MLLVVVMCGAWTSSLINIRMKHLYTILEAGVTQSVCDWLCAGKPSFDSWQCLYFFIRHHDQTESEVHTTPAVTRIRKQSGRGVNLANYIPLHLH
jgi:hypothetical protein